MSDKPKKRRIVFEVTDYCKEEFQEHDLEHMKEGMIEVVADYDLEVTSVKVENVDGK